LIVEARALVCNYGPTRALDGVTVVAKPGQALAVFGPNGAGKSTLLRVLSGERKPDGGELLADGRPVARTRPEWRARVGLVSHRTGLYDGLTVLENLRFFARLYGCRERRTRLLCALERVGGAELAPVRASNLSRGQRQRVALARSLLHDPELVLLDEPFTGLDARGAGLLDATLAQLRAQERTIVLVTHDVSRGLKLADRFLVLCAGRKVLAGSAQEHRPDQVVAAFGIGAPESRRAG